MNLTYLLWELRDAIASLILLYFICRMVLDWINSTKTNEITVTHKLDGALTLYHEHSLGDDNDPEKPI